MCWLVLSMLASGHKFCICRNVEIHRKTTSNMTIVRYTILDIHPVNETHDEQTYCCCSKASASQILIYWEDFAQNCTVLGKSPTHFPIIAQVTVPPVIQYISIWLASYPKMPRFCKPKCSDHFKKILCKNFFALHCFKVNQQ